METTKTNSTKIQIEGKDIQVDNGIANVEAVISRGEEAFLVVFFVEVGVTKFYKQTYFEPASGGDLEYLSEVEVESLCIYNEEEDSYEEFSMEKKELNGLIDFILDEVGDEIREKALE